LISWKYSFEKIGKDLELARKKKQALDDLLNRGKISQNTYGSINTEITNAIAEIEARQKDLAEKMTSRITELEEQINTLEMLLANSELQYAAGEIDEQSHEGESGAFNLALEATKHQLNAIKGIVGEITPQVVPETSHKPTETLETPSSEVVAETKVETPAAETHLEETATETLSEKSLEPEPALEKKETETHTEVPVETTTETPIEEAKKEGVEEPPEALTETEPSTCEETVKEAIEETIVAPEATTEITVEETPKEEKVEVPVEEESFFRDQEDTAEEERHEEKEEHEG